MSDDKKQDDGYREVDDSTEAREFVVQQLDAMESEGGTMAFVRIEPSGEMIHSLGNGSFEGAAAVIDFLVIDLAKRAEREGLCEPFENDAQAAMFGYAAVFKRAQKLTQHVVSSMKAEKNGSGGNHYSDTVEESASVVDPSKKTVH